MTALCNLGYAEKFNLYFFSNVIQLKTGDEQGKEATTKDSARWHHTTWEHDMGTRTKSQFEGGWVKIKKI